MEDALMLKIIMDMEQQEHGLASILNTQTSYSTSETEEQLFTKEDLSTASLNNASTETVTWLTV